ncbi:L domain-like protein [Meira miltonrushii]|uniref:L domain-like protein n=1 Tax=Meira miltonrushii TaxID=1280837 RepID=A0A316VKL2_9BASI|nr:L domain-like protein [Meira miltonrushii]PWN38132.1 L domain-like protein [Meira miltonrushii]
MSSGAAAELSASTPASALSSAQNSTFATLQVNGINLPAAAQSSTSSLRTKEEGKDTPMGEPELLALIIEMRLGAPSSSGGGSNGQSNSLNGSRRTTSNGAGSAMATTSNGPSTSDSGTMDLSHKKIRSLPNEMVDIIKDDIVRLAVGYNFLTTLPSNFVNLSKLRYLNIRANLLSTVPPVLCSLPSLEILDMSRNKVRQLPAEPGRLADLRVLSISNNRLRRLPAWMSRAKNLRILKLEGNPINWPPPHVSVMPPIEKAAVNDLNGDGKANDKAKAQASRSRAEDKHMMLWIAKLKEWIAENEGKAESQEVLDMSNSAITPSATPMSGVEDKVIEVPNVRDADTKVEDIPSAPVEESKANDEIQTVAVPETAPFASTVMSTSPEEVTNVIPVVTNNDDSANTPPSSAVGSKSAGESSNSATDTTPATPPLPSTKWNPKGLGRPNEIISATPPASVVGGKWTGQSSNSVAAVESERNSYFKRLSTLPTSTISTRVSVPVLLCVDATRGVLYALSQMHTALRQYVAFATDERMTSQLSRVLDIAGNSMASLIHSLDRFDSLSRIKGDTLDPLVIRGVVVSCIESIATFRKLIHVVQLQLRSLQRGADIRYTRTLLILLYGSLAEISNSWKTMEPLLDDVAPYLSMGLQSNTSSHLLQQPALPSIAEATSPITPTSSRMVAPPARPHRRRHAGSFSAQDVAHGASLSSSSISAPNVLPSVPISEDHKRANRPPALTSMPSPANLPYSAEQGTLDGQKIGTTPFSANQEQQKQQQAGQAQQQISRRTLSNTSGPKSAGTALYTSQTDVEREIPIDDHLLQLVVKITSVAFSVWAGIEEYLITLGLPKASSGHANKGSNGSMLINPASTADQAGEDSQSKSRLPRSARQQASEVSTLPDNSEQGPTPSTDSNTISGDTTVSNSITQAVEGEETTDTAVTPTNPAPSPAVQRRLRQLHDLTRGVNEHTQRLYGCLERAQDAIYRRTPTPLSPVPTTISASTTNNNPRHHGRAGSTVSSVNSLSTPSNPSSLVRADQNGQNVKHKKENSFDQNKSLSSDTSTNKSSRELFVESNHFIKSILHISHFIKALSAEGFILPKYVKASMAELTTCARDLTLHLHFLSGPSLAPNIGLNPANLSSAPAAVHHNAPLQQQQQRQ